MADFDNKIDKISKVADLPSAIDQELESSRGAPASREQILAQEKSLRELDEAISTIRERHVDLAGILEEPWVKTLFSVSALGSDPRIQGEIKHLNDILKLSDDQLKQNPGLINDAADRLNVIGSVIYGLLEGKKAGDIGCSQLIAGCKREALTGKSKGFDA